MNKISACGPGVLDLLFGLGLHACIRFWIGELVVVRYLCVS
jgi:hypothetical protein